MNLHSIPLENTLPELSTLQKRAIMGLIEHYRHTDKIVVRLVRTKTKLQIQYRQAPYNDWSEFLSGSFSYWAKEATSMGLSVKDFSLKKYITRIL